MKTKSFITNIVLIAGGSIALLAFWRHVSASGSIGLQSGGGWGESPFVFGGLAVLFFSSLGLRPALRLAVATACVSLIAVLYAAELVLASTALGPAANVPFWSVDRATPQRKHEIEVLASKFGVTIDTRDRGEVLAAARQRGIETVPAVMLADVLAAESTSEARESSGTEELMPLGGISNTETLLCNEGQFVSYPSDEHGFRNPRGIWDSPRVDIAAVGQSFAQGYCVPDGKSFVDLLRTQNRLVLNLGTSGESSLLQLAAIKEYLPRYAPKTVLWFFTEGIDLVDLYEESTRPFLMRYLEPGFSQHLITRQPEIDHALRRVVSEVEARERQGRAPVRRSSFVERSMEIARLWTLRQKMELIYSVNSEEPQVWSMLDQKPRNLLSNTLEQARTVTTAWGGTLYFVYLPSWNRYRNNPGADNREHDKVLSLVKALGIPVIDVQPAFQAQNDPLLLFVFRRFGHYNERGNAVVADTVLKSLSMQ